MNNLSPGEDKEHLYRCFDILAPDIGRALAVIAINAIPDKITPTNIASALNNSQADLPNPTFVDPLIGPIMGYLKFPFEKAGVVTANQGDKKGSPVHRSLTLIGQQHAQAVASELARIQLQFPNISFDTIFGSYTRNSGPVNALNRLKLLDGLMKTPYEFILISNFDDHRLYATAKSLYIVGVLQRRLQTGRDTRQFKLNEPRGFQDSVAGDTTLLFHDAAMQLMAEGHTIVTLNDLLNQIILSLPHLDLNADTLVAKFNVCRPSHIAPILQPGFNKGSDKLAVRIARAYHSFINQVIASMKELEESNAARQEAIEYGKKLFKNADAMAFLMEAAFGSEEHIPLGIVAPWYEGWHAGRSYPEQR